MARLIGCVVDKLASGTYPTAANIGVEDTTGSSAAGDAVNLVGVADTELDPVFIRPGITGLWMVHGYRADRTARYVESWPPVRDGAILWRTVLAVTRPDPIQYTGGQ